MGSLKGLSAEKDESRCLWFRLLLESTRVCCFWKSCEEERAGGRAGAMTTPSLTWHSGGISYSPRACTCVQESRYLKWDLASPPCSWNPLVFQPVGKAPGREMKTQVLIFSQNYWGNSNAFINDLGAATKVASGWKGWFLNAALCLDH